MTSRFVWFPHHENCTLIRKMYIFVGILLVGCLDGRVDNEV